jgi:hypothetical protein
MNIGSSGVNYYYNRCCFSKCVTGGGVSVKGGIFERCILSSMWIIGPENLRSEDCYFFSNGDGLQFNTFTGAADFYNPKGGMLIKNLTGGTVNIYTPQGNIIIDSSCTGGTINIYGLPETLTNSGSSTLNQYYVQAKETTLAAKASQVSLDGYGATINVINGKVDVAVSTRASQVSVDGYGATQALDSTVAKASVLSGISARIPAFLTPNGNMFCSLKEVISRTLTENNLNGLGLGFMKFFDTAAPLNSLNDLATKVSLDGYGAIINNINNTMALESTLSTKASQSSLDALKLELDGYGVEIDNLALNQMSKTTLIIT